ncbi:MAG: hypothetical protein IJ911_13755 [Salinivirgaceae bacterium]|nr:hypothetical protein [Salinivirgaceae bacterium]
MISKYIKELIPGNSRIIIPDFGAFMIQDTPNGKVISFNDFLKFNDSVLLNRIITSEKVDAAKGKEAIKAYVANIEAAFKAGENFAVEGVGYLSKDSQNNINFEQDENAKSKGKPKKAAQPKAEALAAEPAKTEAPAAPSTAPTIVSAPKPASPSQPAAEKKPQSQPASAQRTTISNTNYSNNKMEIKTKNNKTLTTVLIIVAALIIVGVLIWMAIDFNWFGRFMPAKEAPAPIEVIDTTPAVDTVAVDTVAVAEEPQPVVVSEPVDPNSMHYHLIAGSFQVESNAIRFQEDMRSRGYDANIVTRRYSAYHYVSIKMFETYSEAVAEWRNMVGENPNLWILVK